MLTKIFNFIKKYYNFYNIWTIKTAQLPMQYLTWNKITKLKLQYKIIGENFADLENVTYNLAMFFQNSIVKSMRNISHTYFYHYTWPVFIKKSRDTIRNFKKIHVNLPKSYLSLQHNFKKNTLWNIKSISHCNDESVEPTSFTEAIFDIISTFGTIQPLSEPTFLFQYMSSVGHP